MSEINYKYFINQKQQFQEASDKLDAYCVDLLNKKRALVDEVDRINNENIKPLKDEMSQIDAELEDIMKSTHQDKITSDNYGAYLSYELSIQVTDRGKALQWALKHPEVLKKDIFKTAEVKALLKEGIVPDPDKNGVNVNDTYTKISFRKK